MPPPLAPPTPSPSPEAGVRSLHFDQITVDQSVQPRAGLRRQKVEEYRDKMVGGVRFPPVVVFRTGDRGPCLLADGFHRLEAAKLAELPTIEARVEVGTTRDAQLFALKANTDHGLPLTSKEKRSAARRLLADPEWSQWSDAEVARQCGVSAMTVSRVRRALASEGDPNNVRVSTRKRRGRSGRVETINVANLGRKRQQAAGGSGPATEGPADACGPGEPRATESQALPGNSGSARALSSAERQQGHRILRSLADVLGRAADSADVVTILLGADPERADGLRKRFLEILDLLGGDDQTRDLAAPPVAA